MTQAGNPELSPHYYRDNFLALCDTVEEQYGDLLAPDELQFLAHFRQLDFDAQCLFVRLVSRVGPWFRESKLAYPELGAIPPIVDELLAAGLVEEAAGLSLEELAGLCTLPELLRAVDSGLSSPAPRGKAALLAAIAELSLDAKDYLRLAGAVDSGRIITPCGLVEVEVLQLLFFGNRHQGLTDFVLSDLGVARYYPYQLDRQHRLFDSREAVEEYLACAQLSDSWYELRELGEPVDMLALATSMTGLSPAFRSSESRWHRLCNSVARDLERLGELELAGELYSLSDSHPARERRLRILERLEDWTGALEMGLAILEQPWCEEERDAAERVLPRVRRRLGGKPAPRSRDNFARLDLVLVPAEAPVELLAAEHLAPGWSAVHYVENSLMNALFGLAFWEQIFTAVPGAFHNPYQRVPTDMYSPKFQERRKEELTVRLAQLRESGPGAALREAYRQYADFQCRWVDWRRINADLVDAVARVIPGDHLLAIWERMLFDPRENRRGFPDLIALGDDPGEYCMVEVKGPGDALQESQKRWLRFFDRQGIPATVAWVSWE